jgi:HSP20 family protein
LTSAKSNGKIINRKEEVFMNLIPKNFFLDDVFDDFLPSKETNSLKCDIYEKDGKYHIEMDAYGFDKNDVNVEYDNGYLTISVSKNEEKKDDTKNYIRRERYSREFKRSFYVGEINSKDILAKFDKGVLKVTLPKEEKQENKKIIDIE